LSVSHITEPDQDEGQVDNFYYTPEAKQGYAHQLWWAMTNYSDYCEPKDGKSHFQVERLMALSEAETEVLAWEVLVSGLQSNRESHVSCTSI
jgi:hypothetical protein